jgi:hypothetical protein
MSVVSGINSYVIEGESGKRLYDQLRSAMEKCQRFDKEYDLGEFMGKHYAIRKEIAKDKDNDLPNYILYVFEGKECIAGSCFDEECVKKSKGALHFTEEWYEISGGFETYVTDSELYLEPGFYFESYNSDDMAGYTNDADGRYFKPSVVYYGANLPELEQARAEGKISEEEYLRRYKKQEAELMKGYDKLSPAEQLEFCNARKGKIFFDTTEIIDIEEWYAYSAEE